MWCSASDGVCLLHTTACASAVGDVLCCARHVTTDCELSSGHCMMLMLHGGGLRLIHGPAPPIALSVLGIASWLH